MLQNIKCSFFLKVLFFHIREVQKLRLTKYNKALQKTLDIRLSHFISFSSSYIIYKSNGKGKQYDRLFDTLIYYGEFKNGKRNGKGKEYKGEDYLIFEGEYKNGKRNGKGKEYSYSFSVEGCEKYYENGWISKRIEKNNDGRLIFEG